MANSEMVKAMKNGVSMTDREMLDWILNKTHSAKVSGNKLILKDGRTFVYGSYRTIKGRYWINVDDPKRYYSYLQEAVNDRNVKINFRGI